MSLLDSFEEATKSYYDLRLLHYCDDKELAKAADEFGVLKFLDDSFYIYTKIEETDSRRLHEMLKTWKEKYDIYAQYICKLKSRSIPMILCEYKTMHRACLCSVKSIRKDIFDAFQNEDGIMPKYVKSMQLIMAEYDFEKLQNLLDGRNERTDGEHILETIVKSVAVLDFIDTVLSDWMITFMYLNIQCPFDRELLRGEWEYYD